MLQLNYKQVDGIVEAMKRMIQINRWEDAIKLPAMFSEMAKQTLNCLICYILASFAETKGETIIWSRFPRYALYRMFEKTYVQFNVTRAQLEKALKKKGIPLSQYEKIVKEKIIEQTDLEFSNFLTSTLRTKEEEIYKAATSIATYIELTQTKTCFSEDLFEEKHRQVILGMTKYENIPGFQELSDTNNELFKLMYSLSEGYLRNHPRWVELLYNKLCNILSHSFSTAVFAYIISLEEKPANEDLATKRFFMGIFHDIAEKWTGDFPSSIKDGIDNLREATEMLEDEAIQENFFNGRPDWFCKAISNILFESELNAAEHKFVLKGADYLSADFECYLQYMSGTRDPYFLGAMLRRQSGIDNGKVALTPLCEIVRDDFLDCGWRCALGKPREMRNISDKEFLKLWKKPKFSPILQLLKEAIISSVKGLINK